MSGDTLYKIMFFEEYRPEPIRTEYAWANTSKEAKNYIRRRGYELDRKNGDHSLLHLFYRDDVHIMAAVERKRIPEYEEPEKKKTPEEIYMSTGACPLCRSEVESDLCQNCGWQRTATWWGRIKTLENFALRKQKCNKRGDRQ